VKQSSTLSIDICEIFETKNMKKATSSRAGNALN